MNQSVHTHQKYRIKLYRSPIFKVIHGFALLVVLIIIVWYIFSLLCFGFSEYFFPESRSLGFYSDIAFPLGLMDLVGYVVALICHVFIAYLLIVSIFFNHISINGDRLFVLFAPRIFFRQYKCDISSVLPVKVMEISWIERLLSYNFQSENLYKFICYDTEFIVSCKDEEHMKMLMEDINPRNNPTEVDDEDDNENILKLTRSEIAICTIIVFCIVYAIQAFLGQFCSHFSVF